MDVVDWHAQLIDQLDWHWQNMLRPRFEGLTDDEYLWEPVPGCWSLRPRAENTTNLAAGTGDLVMELHHPEPVPAPITTIAWRLGHLAIPCFGTRAASHFGAEGETVSPWTTDWPATAAGGLALLDEQHDRWMTGIRSLDDAGLAAPVGPAEGAWADAPMAGLILHLNREAIHHGAEIALLRDLYARRGDDGAR